MKAIEVSSILKLLEGKEDGHKIEQELRKIEKRKEKVYVSNYTLLELAYLLEFVYGLSRERVEHGLGAGAAEDTSGEYKMTTIEVQFD